MRRCLVFLGFAGCAAVAAAQSTDAPLADTKKQLQSLQKDRAAEKTDTGASAASGLRGAITTIETPAPIALPNPPTAKERNERDAKQKADASRNWLLDGYDKLNRRRDGTLDARPGSADPAEEDKPLDPADPNYFLLVYEKQRAEAIARRQEADTRATRTEGDGVPDAFAPFLQDWLAGSPVRDALRDASGGRSEASQGATPGVAGAGDTPGHFNLSGENRGAGESGVPNPSDTTRAAGTVAANPFVQALGLPITPEAKALEFRPPTAAANPAPAPVLPNLIPPPAGKSGEEGRRALAPPAQDAKKYFPQLKKF